MFGDGHHQTEDVRLLETVRSQNVGGNLPGKGDDRGRIQISGGDTGDQVGCSGTGGRKAYSGSAFHTGIPVGHMCGSLLVPGQYVSDIRIVYLVIQWQRCRSRYTEYDVYSVRSQHIQNYL